MVSASSRPTVINNTRLIRAFLFILGLLFS
jgi:hypothetical protein